MEAEVAGTEEVPRPEQGSCVQHRHAVVTQEETGRCLREDEGDSETIKGLWAAVRQVGSEVG